MPQKAETEMRWEDEPIVWFGELLVSVDRGDYPRAATAQAELDRLGWRVDRRKRRKTTCLAVPS